MKTPTKNQLMAYFAQKNIGKECIETLIGIMNGTSPMVTEGESSYDHSLKISLLSTGMIKRFQSGNSWRYDWVENIDETIDNIMQRCAVCGCGKTKEVTIFENSVIIVYSKYCVNCETSKTQVVEKPDLGPH